MKRDLTEKIESSIINSTLVKKVSAPVDGLLNRSFQTTILRPVKLFFNGTWIGHPLHPLLTDIPIGAWTLTIIFSLAGLVFHVSYFGVAAGVTTGIGLAGAAGAIVAGLMDWMDVDPPEKAVGAVHATLNTAATVIFLVSLVMGYHNRWQLTWGAFAVVLTGYLLMTAGAFLGGGLVYHLGVMINRNAYRTGPAGFQFALAVGELAESQPRRVEVEGQPILLVKSAGKIYALGAVCSHYGAPLNEGKLEGDSIQCPWHFSRFALQDGSVREGPACAAVPSYEVKIVSDQIHIRMRS
jgi:nitrite reductase/ring-hydroxylating ferredoxin subunit/uncharacterized membrane protein